MHICHSRLIFGVDEDMALHLKIRTQLSTSYLMLSKTDLGTYNMDHYATRYPTNVEDIASFLVRLTGWKFPLISLLSPNSTLLSLGLKRDIPPILQCSSEEPYKSSDRGGSNELTERLSSLCERNRRFGSGGWPWSVIIRGMVDREIEPGSH